MRVRIVSISLLVEWLVLGAAARGGFADDSINVRVPATQPWTETAVQVSRRQALTLEASGQIQVVRLTWKECLFGYSFDRVVGPAGTYVWPRHYQSRPHHSATTTFPLAAGEDGPAPAFGLIAKIGTNGTPFYVGAHYAGEANASGTLWLGVNDYDVTDNRGAFDVLVRRGTWRHEPPVEVRPVLDAAHPGRPLPGARVLLLYVDGLRPDVMHEMAAAGFLPNLKAQFVDHGVECVHAFTTFPSNTLVANGALFTGLFPDRTGIKSQNQFERTTLRSRGPMSEWLPNWLVVRTAPQTHIIDLLDKFAPENTHEFLVKRGIPTLGSRLQGAYRYTVLPILPVNPPLRWLHRALNGVRNPLVATVKIPTELDRINAGYVVNELLGDPDARVIAAWFPMLDKNCHHHARGQFGAARRDLAIFDRLFGQILAKLREVGWDRSTYLLLISDHGHVGGERAANRRANLPRDFFHRQLGCNVKVVGQSWRYPGLDRTRFVFLDHQGAGQAAIFLPKGAYATGLWQPNRLDELMRYDFGPNRGMVNLLESLSQFRGPEWTPDMPNPVDLVLVKVDATRVLVFRAVDNQAIIHLVHGDDGVERYRYEPIRRIHVTPTGEVETELPLPGTDPLRFFSDAALLRALDGVPLAEWIRQPHTAGEWLRITADSEYPDAIVGIAKCFQWKPPVTDLAEARDPDLLVTAARGWSFRSDDGWGTDHGSLLRESMRMSLFVAGPNIRSGLITEPHRIIDVLPTILQMIQWPHDPHEMDGQAIQGLYD